MNVHAQIVTEMMRTKRLFHLRINRKKVQNVRNGWSLSEIFLYNKVIFIFQPHVRRSVPLWHCTTSQWVQCVAVRWPVSPSSACTDCPGMDTWHSHCPGHWSYWGERSAYDGQCRREYGEMVWNRKTLASFARDHCSSPPKFFLFLRHRVYDWIE